MGAECKKCGEPLAGKKLRCAACGALFCDPTCHRRYVGDEETHRIHRDWTKRARREVH